MTPHHRFAELLLKEKPRYARTQKPSPRGEGGSAKPRRMRCNAGYCFHPHKRCMSTSSPLRGASPRGEEMATRDLTRDGTAETKRSGVYTPKYEADEVTCRKANAFRGSYPLISRLRRQLLHPLRGGEAFAHARRPRPVILSEAKDLMGHR